MLYTLALRLLTSPFEDAHQQGQLLTGELPEDFPKEIPFLSNTTIIGSLVLYPRNIQAVFNVPVPAKQVMKFYSQALAEVGTNLGIAIVPKTSETLQRLQDHTLRFRLKQSRESVMLTAAPINQELTDLRMQILKSVTPRIS